MPVIDQEGRLLRLVNIVDLLVVLLGVAVMAAGSVLLLPRTTAGPLTAVVGVGSFIGLVLLSRRRHGVTWTEVWAAARDAWPSRPYLQGIWDWFTAEPDPEVIVIDLRETVTVGPVITVLDWVIGQLAAIYRGSSFEQGISAMGTFGLTIAERSGLARVIRLIGRVLEPPEPPDED